MFLAHVSQAETGKYSMCVSVQSSLRGRVVINWAAFQLWALFLLVLVPLQASNVCLPQQSKGLNEERGSFLLAANSRQSAQPLVILLRIHGVGKQGNLGKRLSSHVESLKQTGPFLLFFFADKNLFLQ